MNNKISPKVIVDGLSGIFLPVINVLTACSIIKSLVMLLANTGVLQTSSGIYQIFYGVSDGFFYFLPFMLAVTCAKQFKCDLFIALLLPCAMLYPDLIKILEGSQNFTFCKIPVLNAVYHSSVIPVVLGCGLLHFVEIPCDKYLSQTIKGFLKPIICAAVVIPVTMIAFGPLGTFIGNGLTFIFLKAYNLSPVVAGAFMGFVIQPMVAIGAHWALVPVVLNNIALNGHDVIMPLLAGAVMAQGGAVLAVALCCPEESEKRRLAYQASFTAALGVSEPAIFGFNLPLVRPLIAGCISGAITGAFIGHAGTLCHSFAFPSPVTSIAFTGQGFIQFLVSMPVGFALGFLLTWLQKKKITVLLEQNSTAKD